MSAVLLTGTPQAPAPVRMTRAAVIAGLGTDVAAGVAVSLWLPWVGRVAEVQ